MAMAMVMVMVMAMVMVTAILVSLLVLVPSILEPERQCPPIISLYHLLPTPQVL